MTTVHDAPVDQLIAAVASDLKDNIKTEKPAWAEHVKTGTSRERQPEDTNWWWIRSASVLRRVYLNGPIGVQRLRSAYGSKKRRGVEPGEFRRASGKILRTILQQLDKAEFTKKSLTSRGLADKSQVIAGREITPKGMAYLDKIASSLVKNA